jgi:4a-hydroxytetrahydrobiopterin dehydratase
MSDTVTAERALETLPGWRVLAGRLHLTVATKDFASALRLVERIGVLAEEQQHHPDIDLRWGRVHVVTSSHDVGGLSQRDVVLGRSITAILDEMDLAPDLARLTGIELAIDALDIDSIRPFWRAVLGYEGDSDVMDPDAILPLIWFQQMDEPRPQRNRIHLDVWVAPEEAEARMARAIEAGGRLVSDSEAPAFWILADPEGNEACICTSLSRD